MEHALEVAQGERFEFGANWQRFLTTLDNAKIELAKRSLLEMLKIDTLEGRTFLDIGSGSGLFSLAARMLGATVHSFDYDPKSVACTQELKRRYFPKDELWTIEEGSALDTQYLESLGQFDIVYSWGVLHHTGNMKAALDNAAKRVKPSGKLWIAIYNDQGWISKYWHTVKKLYNSNPVSRFLVTAYHLPYLFGLRVLVRALTGRLKYERGMTYWYDAFDWLGGFPFEVATPGEIIGFYAMRGFIQTNLRTCGRRMGCNEFVFDRAQLSIGSAESQP